MLGFALAQGSGIRWLGALVLIIGGGWCAVQLWRRSGWPATLLVGVVYSAAFVLSHPLGRAIGTWPGLVLVSAVTAATAYAMGRPSGGFDRAA